jgi:hypothetical protein
VLEPSPIHSKVPIFFAFCLGETVRPTANPDEKSRCRPEERFLVSSLGAQIIRRGRQIRPDGRTRSSAQPFSLIDCDSSPPSLYFLRTSPLALTIVPFSSLLDLLSN